MHSVTLERNGSPKKRTLSRGMSEDESLRSIIKETESSSRRLTRSDSRCGTLKKRSDSQSDQDLFMGLPEMLELQASYDEVVQELRGLEVEREALLFQVDVLQDTLEGVEELLAEAQREAGQASMELEREREANRKLENMVCSLMREVERLKEERNTAPLAAEHEREDEATKRGHQMKKEHSEVAHSENQSSYTSSRGLPEEVGQGGGSPLRKLHRMVTETPGQMATLALDTLPTAGILRRPCASHLEDRRDPSPDRNNDTDSQSAYEDASADTPELDRVFPGAEKALELPDDADDTVSDEGNPADLCQANDSEPQNPRNNDFCILS
ncbi:leucine-rich repeat flightless-interacting protein 2 isoform X2 [Myripristis murdjan]|uniref:leucine-rich repeat flightless-interacting protein 2 isoform X2 n=1 Tax=Myripristis murdjan TaxID=586833 RepID=UPI001175E334|nr:leucine-rich repeat flightless-interacting protein 2-like isoform X2 [Myripristis murdjan]